MKRILAVDDEEHILELVAYNLEQEGYEVLKAYSGEEVMPILENNPVNLVLLDWMLPGMDGIEVLKLIRSHEVYQKIPVIFVTAKGDEISKVVGLMVGSDDYIVKPFGIHELSARIKAVLRRSELGEYKPFGSEDKNAVGEDGNNKEGIILLKGIEIDKRRRTVKVGGNVIDLSLKEFELLYLLAKNKGIVFSRDTLLEKIWGYDYLGETRTVDVHISNLRKKIEKDESHPEIIKTIRGIGYKAEN